MLERAFGIDVLVCPKCSGIRRFLVVFGGMQHLPELVAVQKQAARWLPLLQQHHLAGAQTFGGVTEHGWQLRILW